ncbi:MAG: hypothetical protein HYX32_11660 [Actinobacteria bacterium]|nr:hypothetical protein [Actinomycetota bacterium]
MAAGLILATISASWSGSSARAQTASGAVTEGGKATTEVSDGGAQVQVLPAAPAAPAAPVSGGPALHCTYNVVGVVPVFDFELVAAAANPTVGNTYRLRCIDPVTGALVVDEDVVYTAGLPPIPPAVLAQTARQRAEAQLDPPEPALGVNPPAGRQLVGVPTWLWIEDPWQPVSATATVGGVSSTVTASPRDVRWDLGDGTTVVCDGPGAAYDLGRRPGEQSSDCTHTYIDRSTVNDPDGTYTVTATVTFDVSWTATTGQGGDLGTITRSSATALTVREAQALIN